MIQRLAMLIFTALVALTAIPAAAQDDAITGDLASLDGIEASVQRLWTVDFSTLMMTGTPLPDNGLPDGLVVLQAGVSRFESVESATAAFATLVSQAEAEQAAVIVDVGDQGEVTSEVNDAYGDESFVYLAAVPEEQAVVRMIIVRSGAYILMAFGFGTNVAAMDGVDALATSLVDEGSERDQPEVFDAAGASTGGLWGFMPAGDAPFLAGLHVAEDEIVFPIPSGQSGSRAAGRFQ